MKKFLKDIFGITDLEKQREENKQKFEKDYEDAVLRTAEALKQEEEAKEAARIAKLSPKELATEQQEPWVTVLNTHINKDNVRNGFFELDWNSFFVDQLRQHGYQGQTEEEIVDKWFKVLCQS